MVTISTSCPVAVVVVGGAGRGDGRLGRGGAGGRGCVEFAIVDSGEEAVSSGQSKTGWPRTLPPTP